MHILKKLILIGTFGLLLGGCTSVNIYASEGVAENSINNEMVSSVSDSSEALKSKLDSDNTNWADNVWGWTGVVVGISALFVSVYTVITERNNRQEDKVDNTFFNLIDLHNTIKDKIDGGVINAIYNSIESRTNSRQKSFIKCNKNIKQIEYVMSNQEKIRGIIQSLSTINNDKYRSSLDDIKLPKYDESTFQPLREELAIIEGKLSGKLNKENAREIVILIESLSNDDICKLNTTNVFEEFLNISGEPHIFDDDEKFEICNAVYGELYDEVGHYFRIFHRVIKYVNINVKDRETKKNYIGILRALLSETEMLVIFYNSFYTDKGYGLGQHLLYTSFFGEPKDLPFSDEHKELQHFSRKNLIWGDSDISKMRECELKISCIPEVQGEQKEDE